MKHSYLSLWVLLVCSCVGQPGMMHDQIRFPEGTVPSLFGGEVVQQAFPSLGEKDYCMIHYDASRLCGPCLLRQYYLWDELIIHLGEENVSYLFVLEPAETVTYDVLSEALNDKYFSQPVYLDPNGLLRRGNVLKLRSGSIDILTDRDGKVLLVGDLRNNHRFYYKLEREITHNKRHK